ncbi:MAG: aldo/keto reductase, partial [Phototrophicaceae bacterium]
MKYSKVIGLKQAVSCLIQGTVYFSDQRLDEAFTQFDAVFKHGCNAFDTAHTYFDGECERALGAWIEARGIRDDVVIIGKGAHPDQNG